jgi:ribosome-associated toxin RatA of RatAB toxin-antitoxin module
MARSISYTRKISEPIDRAFEIISTYENYKNFIPGCIDSRVISEERDMQVGQLEFEMFGKSYLIESKNKQSDFKLEIEQIRGPFESFKGCWNLVEKEKKTEISFNAAFTLPFLINAVTPDSLIHKLSETIIESFIAKLS